MKIKELNQYIEKECINGEDNVETLLIRLIYDNKIDEPCVIFNALGEMYQKRQILVNTTAEHINKMLQG